MTFHALTVQVLEATRFALSDAPLDFERDNRAAIDENWRHEIAAKPRLWNGDAYLFDDVRIDGRTLSATGHRTDFATFLYWRAMGRPAGLTHITGTSLPVTADGALMAIRMAEHTANAGEYYFPAGSFDAADLMDGHFDVTANIRRELAEETGIVVHNEHFDGRFAAIFDRNAWHIARRSRLALSQAECVEAVSRHQAATGDDEISGLLTVRADDGSADLLKPYARCLAGWHFDHPF